MGFGTGQRLYLCMETEVKCGCGALEAGQLGLVGGFGGLGVRNLDGTFNNLMIKTDNHLLTVTHTD